jgi:hypothetical protein
LYSVETHRAVMKWMLKVVRKHGLADGQSVCIDGTTLQANAAVKSLVRRDTGVSYGAELRALLRNGRAEAGLCAGPGQCIEAGTGAGGSVQHGIAAAEVERMGQAAASSGTENRLDCAPIRCIHRPGRVQRRSKLVGQIRPQSFSTNHRRSRPAGDSSIEAFPPRAARLIYLTLTYFLRLCAATSAA